MSVPILALQLTSIISMTVPQLIAPRCNSDIAYVPYYSNVDTQHDMPSWHGRTL